MKNRGIFFIFAIAAFFLASLTPFSSAYLGSFPIGECVNLGTNLNTTQVNISVKYPNSTFAVTNQIMTFTPPSSFDYLFCNTSTLGRYVYNYKDLQGNTYENIFTIGQEINLSTAFIQVFLLLFFFVLGFIYYSLRNTIDFDKWYNSILKKYETKNFVKLVLSALAFNLMKNAFVIYYLIGLPIVISLVDISLAYGLLNLLNIFQIILYIYLVGVILVGAIFLSFIQEWIMDLVDQLKNMDWGVGK